MNMKKIYKMKKLYINYLKVIEFNKNYKEKK